MKGEMLSDNALKKNHKEERRIRKERTVAGDSHVTQQDEFEVYSHLPGGMLIIILYKHHHQEFPFLRECSWSALSLSSFPFLLSLFLIEV